MKNVVGFFAVMASFIGVCQAATIINNVSGLTVDTFNTGTVAGTSFTDAMGNVLTVAPQTFSLPPTPPSYVWSADGDLIATFASPVTAVGFTFLNLCGNCGPVIPNFGEFESVSLDNGDSYGAPIDIPAGSGVPTSFFEGVSSTSPFTQATFQGRQFSSFIISDFRFGVSTAPEPETSLLIAPALVLLAAGLKLRARRQRC